MEKEQRTTRTYRRLVSRQPEHQGQVRIGRTTISLPVEHLLYLGRPAWLYFLVCDRALHLFACDGHHPDARKVGLRGRRFRGYIHLRPEERLLLIPDLYNPVPEFDRGLRCRSLRLPNAVR